MSKRPREVIPSGGRPRELLLCCPICESQIPSSRINSHIDKCSPDSPKTIISTINAPENGLSLISCKKTLILIRHAEPDYSSSRFDPSLTRNGILQALALKQKLQDVRADIVLLSPLRRAIETCLHSNDKIISIPVKIMPEIAEKLATTSDLGSDVSVLKSLFPQLNFDGISSKWWNERVNSPLNDRRDGKLKVAETTGKFAPKTSSYDINSHIRTAVFT